MLPIITGVAELIGQALTDCIREIDRICEQNQLTPAALTAPSRKAYAWMKFLTDKDNLKLPTDCGFYPLGEFV